MFGFSFDFFNDMEVYELEIKQGNAIQRQQLQGSEDMIKMQYLQIMREISQVNQPVKITLKKGEQVWVPSHNENKTLINSLMFANKSYMAAFPKEFE